MLIIEVEGAEFALENEGEVLASGKKVLVSMVSEGVLVVQAAIGSTVAKSFGDRESRNILPEGHKKCYWEE